MSQTSAFDSAVRNLYFGVDIIKESNSLVDTLMTKKKLHHNDTVIRQSNLNLSIQFNTSTMVWSGRHVFTFTESHLPGFNINYGVIEVSRVESTEIKQLLGIDWRIIFNTKYDAKIYFNKLKEIFEQVSTKQKIEFDKYVGYIAQYSTRKQSDNGIRDISFTFGKFPQSKKYEISLSLINEFVGD
jgi:hypothetical protein